MPDLRAALLIQWIPHPLRACPQFWSFTTSKLIHAINVLGNPAIIAYQQDMDAVNRFCSFNRLPPKLKRELRRYMYNTKEVHLNRVRASIYSKFSPLLVTKASQVWGVSIRTLATSTTLGPLLPSSRDHDHLAVISLSGDETAQPHSLRVASYPTCTHRHPSRHR